MTDGSVFRVNIRIDEATKAVLDDLAKRQNVTATAAIIRALHKVANMYAQNSDDVADDVACVADDVAEQDPHSGMRLYLKCYTRVGKYTAYDVVMEDGKREFVNDGRTSYEPGDIEEEWWFPSQAEAVNKKPYDHDFYLLDMADIRERVKVYEGPPRVGIPNNPAVTKSIQRRSENED